MDLLDAVYVCYYLKEVRELGDEGNDQCDTTRAGRALYYTASSRNYTPQEAQRKRRWWRKRGWKLEMSAATRGSEAVLKQMEANSWK